MIKIKFDLGWGEYRNVWANVIRINDHYEIYFDDGFSWEKWAYFNPVKRCFYGS